MLQLFRVILLLLLFSQTCLGAIANLKEEDGTPDIYPWQLRVTNGTLTDNGDGTASLNVAGSTGAPTDATYITQTANATLSAEQALSALGTGLLKNTTTTGVLSIATAGSDYVATESDPVVKAISGIVKANGSAVSAAVANTDYLPVDQPSITTSLTLTDDDWVGMGAAAGRIEFDDQSTDEVNILNANVGIGNSTPASPLHVTGQTRIYLNGSDSASPALYIANAANSRVWGLQLSAGSDLSVWNFNGSTWSNKISVLHDTGYVGIGDASPAALFTVGSGDLFQVNSSGQVATASVLDTSIATTADVLLSSFGVTLDGGGSAITTGVKGFISIPYNGAIQSWDIFADQSGSIVLDIWKDTFANAPPTVADTIAGSEKPTLSSASKNQDTNLTTWTTSVSAGDVIGFNVDSASTVTRVTVVIKIKKT